jgi:hypothetical protein
MIRERKSVRMNGKNEDKANEPEENGEKERIL